MQAVAAVIRQGSRFLLGKRSEHKKLSPGWWSPISGRIEPGETPAEAAVRECWEEIGVRTRALQPLTEIDVAGGTIRLHFWLIEIIEGQPRLENDENSELRWFSIEEMKSTPQVFAEDIVVFERLLASETTET